MSAPVQSPFATVGAAAMVGAGLVHAAAAGTHTGDTPLVWLFAVTAVVQVATGAALHTSATRPLILASVAINLGVAGAWIASRTTGLPVVASLSAPEEVGFQDLMATGLELIGVLFAVTALRGRPAVSRFALASWLPVVVVGPALLGVTAPHAHGGDHEHGTAADETTHATDGHDHDEAATPEAVADGHEHEDGGASGRGSDPIFAGADTANASEHELETAKELIESTRMGITSQFTDEASVLAAGYVSIGDGRRSGSFEHFINGDYMSDGRELDPDHVESLVFQNTGGGKELVSAMYILERGETMADVPNVGGDLAAWHDHQNLCWDESGTRLAGILVGDRCVPGGTVGATAPMLHVWLTDHECGPFAGIEGHGSGCTHEH